jgi:hypothetical protein
MARAPTSDHSSAAVFTRPGRPPSQARGEPPRPKSPPVSCTVTNTDGTLVGTRRELLGGQEGIALHRERSVHVRRGTEAAEEDDAVHVRREVRGRTDHLGPHALRGELSGEGLCDAGALRGDGQPLHAVDARAARSPTRAR